MGRPQDHDAAAAETARRLEEEAMASEQLKIVLQILEANPLPKGVSVQEMRDGIEKMLGTLPIPEGITTEAVEANGVPCEWTDASGADPERVLLYLHGGGYVVGSLNTHRGQVAGYSIASGARALSVGYRLAPEHPHPAAVEDAAAAYRWLLGQGIEAGRIAVAGDSAGGGLTAAVLVALRDAGDPLPACGVMISPWVDMEGSGESVISKAGSDPMVGKEELLQMAETYLGGLDPRTPLASPLYAELAGLPPLLIHVGTAEILLDDARRFASRASEAGVDVSLKEWEDMIHVFQAYAMLLPEGKQAVDEIGAFIREHLRP
jgi:acetyl esterase/lipase